MMNLQEEVSLNETTRYLYLRFEEKKEIVRKIMQKEF